MVQRCTTKKRVFDQTESQSADGFRSKKIPFHRTILSNLNYEAFAEAFKITIKGETFS